MSILNIYKIMLKISLNNNNNNNNNNPTNTYLLRIFDLFSWSMTIINK